MAIAEQVITAVGVLAGAGTSLVGSALSERARSRRSQAERWDETRLSVLAAYGEAVKACFTVATRIVAAREAGEGRKVDDTLTLAELHRVSKERESKWERVLLLGDSPTIAAGRAWHESIWVLERFAVGEENDAGAWREAKSASGQARDRYYQCVRRSLRIPDEDIPPPRQY